MTRKDNELGANDNRCTERPCKTSRFIKTIREVRNDPEQELDQLLKRLGISRSQFYKDKNNLAKIGFVFNYKKNRGFRITEDKLSESIDLSLSDRILVLFSLRHLYATDEGHLTAKALEVGRKLAYGIEEPFRSHEKSTNDNIQSQPPKKQETNISGNPHYPFNNRLAP